MTESLSHLPPARIIRSNALALPLADDSVDLVVTSPPYFGLRSYQDGGKHYAGQIGSEATPAEFVDALLAATREMVRVLKPSGSIWVNLGDRYASSPGAQGATGQRADRAQAVTYESRPLPMGFRAKSLIGIPWRYALRCIDELGLILRAEVIWSKPNGLPESVTDRVRRSHETWFHFTRSPRYFSAVDEIREPHQATKQGRSTDGWRPGPSGQNRGTEVGRAHDDGDPLRYFALSPLGKLPGSVWEIATQPLKVPVSLGIDHFAAFPMEWPRRIIQGWSPAGVCTACSKGRRPVVARDRQNTRPLIVSAHHKVHSLTGEPDGREFSRGETSATITGYSCACGQHNTDGQWITNSSASRNAFSGISPSVGADGGASTDLPKQTQSRTMPPTRPAVVLDPFGGTGTTALVAHTLGRRGISLDMSADYCRLAQWRTTDPGEHARALQVDKPAQQVEGQISMLDLLEDGGAA